MFRHCTLLLSILFLCGLISCGNTGDLYLPDNTPITENAQP